MVESLTKIVNTLLDTDDHIRDSIARKYANYSAIARLIKPKIEKKLKKKLALSGIITAVKRYNNINIENFQYKKIIAESRINLRTDIAKLSLDKTTVNLKKSRLISLNFPNELFQILEGATKLTIITDQKIFKKILIDFKKEIIIYKKSNLAEIMIQSPLGIVETPGCIASFYQRLARAQINIEETISCFTETIIILNMQDVAKAFTVLTDLIMSTRKVLEKNSG